MPQSRRAIAGLCWLVAACQSFVGDYTADLEVERPLSVSSLCQLEQDNFVTSLALDSEDALSSLEAYYAEANPDLVEHLQEVAQLYADGMEHRGVTYLRGTAGVGKSFVTNNLTDSFDADDQCGVEMADLFGKSEADLGFRVSAQPDLTTLDRRIVFNTLPGIDDPTKFSVELLFAAMGCSTSPLPPLIVLDGIDEIHPDSSRLILEALDDYLLDATSVTGPFLHVLVSGRPEGFTGWLIDPDRKQPNVDLVKQFELEAPRYDSSGDLAFRVRGYLSFARDPAPSEAEIAAHVESFTDALTRYGFLSYSIGNLALGNIVIDQTAPGLNVSERSLKDAVFDDILLRNVGTHGRPGAGSEHEVSYRRLLEDAAARYADVDASGRFTVRSEDQLEAFDADGSSTGRVRSRNLLNRAGLVLLTEPNSATTRYRFDPFWLHAHLLERRNQRIVERHGYQGCE